MRSIKFRQRDDCRKEQQSPSSLLEGNGAVLGGFMFGTAWGTECSHTPNVPPISLSNCDDWLDDPPNEYMDPPRQTNLCMNNETFCESYFLALECTNRTACQIPQTTFDKVLSDFGDDTTNYGSMKKYATTLPEDYWYNTQYYSTMLPYDVQSASGGWTPIDPGPPFMNQTISDPVPPSRLTGSLGVPLHYATRNQSCYALYQEHKDAYYDDLGEFVKSSLEKMLWTYTPAVVATLYLPFATDHVVSLLYTFKISPDGTYVLTEDVHTKPLTGKISADFSWCLELMALCLSATACIQIYSQAVRIVTTKKLDSSDTVLGTRWQWVLLGLTVVALGVSFVYNMIQFDKCYLRLFFDGTQQSKDSFVRVTNITVWFYVTILVEEVSEMLAARANMQSYFVDSMWNMLDWLVCCFGIASTAYIKRSAEWLGELDEEVNRNIFPPYNSWREQTIIAQYNIDNITAILLAITTFFIVCRLFKFLSIIPTLVVPFEALRKSKYEIGAFVVTLVLFLSAYSLFFFFMFGADIEEFSGVVLALQQLLNAAFDDFDEDVYNRLGELDNWTESAGLGMIFFFRFVITLSFMNMLITITMEWYTLERERLKTEKKNAEAAKMLKMWSSNMLQQGKSLRKIMRRKQKKKPEADVLEEPLPDTEDSGIKPYQRHRARTSEQRRERRRRSKSGGPQSSTNLDNRKVRAVPPPVPQTLMPRKPQNLLEVMIEDTEETEEDAEENPIVAAVGASPKRKSVKEAPRLSAAAVAAQSAQSRLRDVELQDCSSEALSTRPSYFGIEEGSARAAVLPEEPTGQEPTVDPFDDAGSSNDGGRVVDVASGGRQEAKGHEALWETLPDRARTVSSDGSDYPDTRARGASRGRGTSDVVDWRASRFEGESDEEETSDSENYDSDFMDETSDEGSGAEDMTAALITSQQQMQMMMMTFMSTMVDGGAGSPADTPYQRARQKAMSVTRAR